MTHILTHLNCIDGEMAAYAAQQKYPDAVVNYYLAGNLNMEIIRSLPSKRIVILDLFVNGLEPIEGKEIIVIDHHKWKEQPKGVTFFHSIERSACCLAWQYFNQGPIPELLLYAEDRDLFTKKLPNCDEIIAAYYERKSKKLPTIEAFDAKEWAAEGTELIKKRNEKIELVVKAGMPKKFRKSVFPTQHKVLLITDDDRTLRSDACQEAVKKGYDIAIFYNYSPDKSEVWLALRAAKVDVAEISNNITNKKGIGGGHMLASGATIDESTKFYVHSVNPNNWIETLFEDC